MYANVSEVTARHHDPLARAKACWNPDGFYRHIYAPVTGQRHSGPEGCPLNWNSAPPIEYQLRSASAPISPAIPEFDAANSALVPRQVNCPCRTPAADSIPNLNLGVSAVLEMHHHALDFDVATLNKKADRSEPAAGIDTNGVMIALAIYTRIPEAYPPAIISPIPIVSTTPLGIYGETEAQHEQQRTEQTN